MIYAILIDELTISGIDIPFRVGRTPQITLYATINLITNLNSPALVSSPNPTSSEVDNTPVIESDALLPVAQDFAIANPGTSTEQAEVSNDNAEKALHDAGNAVEAMGSYQSWERTIGRIEWVMNSLISIAEVCPLPDSLLPPLDLVLALSVCESSSWATFSYPQGRSSCFVSDEKAH